MKILNLDHLAVGLDKIGKHIPGISILTDIIKTAVTAWNDRDKKLAVNRFAGFFGSLVSTDQLIETLARQLTLSQETTIKVIKTSSQIGVARRLFQGLKINLTANDIDNAIKEMADKQCKLLLSAIMQGKLDPHPALADLPLLMAPILGPTFRYVSPVPKAAPVLSPVAASAPMGTDDAATRQKALEMQLKQQAEASARREAEAELRQKALEAQLKQQAEAMAKREAEMEARHQALVAHVAEEAAAARKREAETEKLKAETKAIQKTLKEAELEVPVAGNGNQAQLQINARTSSHSPTFFAHVKETQAALRDVKEHTKAIGKAVSVQGVELEDIRLNQAKQQEKLDRLADKPDSCCIVS